MSSEPAISASGGGSLALRLTLWYAAIHALSSALALGVVYFVIVGIVHERAREDLRDDVEEFATLFEAGGMGRIEHEMRLDTNGEEAEKSFFRLWTPSGELLFATDLTAFPGLQPPAKERLATAGRSQEQLVGLFELPERDVPIRRAIGGISSDLVLEIGESTEDDEEFVAALAQGFLATLVVVVLLGAPIGWFMARRALRGVEEVTRAATEIAAGSLDRRVAVHGHGDELGRLALAFNAMLDRIQSLLVGMREMSDNLAHDIRSPLTRIRAAAELSSSAPDAGSHEASLAATATEECDRLLEMINSNLEITEVESGAARLELVELDLVALVLDACEIFQTVAEDLGIELKTVLPSVCLVRVDRQRLQRVVANLLDNALKYTPAGGRVTITLAVEEARIRLDIEDTGIGVSPEEAAKIFKRFYRSDHSRSKLGNGLGLSLSLANVRAHGGEILLDSTPGEGSRFTVILPIQG